jgi:hypothetical protein
MRFAISLCGGGRIVAACRKSSRLVESGVVVVLFGRGSRQTDHGLQHVLKMAYTHMRAICSHDRRHLIFVSRSSACGAVHGGGELTSGSGGSQPAVLHRFGLYLEFGGLWISGFESVTMETKRLSVVA